MRDTQQPHDRSDVRKRRVSVWLMCLAMLVGLGSVVVGLRSMNVWRLRGHSPLPSNALHTTPGNAEVPLGAQPPASVASYTPHYVLSPANTVRDATAAMGVFEGHVVSLTDDRPVPHAALTFLHAQRTLAVGAFADGSFRLEPTEQGTYELVRIGAEGFVPFEPEPGFSPIRFEARAGVRVRDVVLHIAPQEPCRGLVIDAEGRPVAGAHVRFLDRVPGTSEIAFESNAAGEFDLPRQMGGMLEARHPEFLATRVIVGLAEAQSRRIVIRMLNRRANNPQVDRSDLSAISGCVLGPNGAPIAGATVSCIFGDDANTRAMERELHPRSAAVTGFDGAFMLEGLDPGRYDVSAAARGFAPSTVHDVPASSRVELRLGVSHAIRGIVRDPAGAPVTAFSISVARRAGAVETHDRRTVATFDPDGAYLLTDLAPGTYVIGALAAGFARAREIAVIVSDTEDTTSHDLVLGRGGTIFGRVIDARSSAPLERAHVTIEEAGLSDNLTVARTVTTDTGGAFTISGLAPGPGSILVSAEDHHGRTVSGLPVVESSRTGPIEVALTPAARDEQPHIDLVGIGAVLTAHGDGLRIVAFVTGGGAQEAGLAIGDIVLAVDGDEVATLGFQNAIQRIRGPEGTVVRLVIQRDPDNATFAVAVARRRVQQ